jgi:hypothetical protein
MKARILALTKPKLSISSAYGRRSSFEDSRLFRRLTKFIEYSLGISSYEQALILLIKSSRQYPLKGSNWAHSSYKTTPRAHMSCLLEKPFPVEDPYSEENNSGGKWLGVPAVLSSTSSSLSLRQVPKSPSLMRLKLVKKMLLDLISRWIILRE